MRARHVTAALRDDSSTTLLVKFGSTVEAPVVEIARAVSEALDAFRPARWAYDSRVGSAESIAHGISDSLFAARAGKSRGDCHIVNEATSPL